MRLATGCWLLAALAWPAALLGQGGASTAATSVTVFNSGRVLVRRTLPIAVPAGASTQTLALGEFNPVTFTVLDAGVQLVSVKTDQTLSEETLLRRYVGRTLDIDTGRAAVASRRATLLAMDPERWEWSDRPGVIFGRPGRIVWPKDLVPTVKLADVAAAERSRRQSIKVMYETTGSSWAASYRLFLGAQGRLEGAALLGAGTLLLPDAEVQLLSGDIGQGTPPTLQQGYATATNGFEDASIHGRRVIGQVLCTWRLRAPMAAEARRRGSSLHAPGARVVHCRAPRSSCRCSSQRPPRRSVSTSSAVDCRTTAASASSRMNRTFRSR